MKYELLAPYYLFFLKKQSAITQPSKKEASGVSVGKEKAFTAEK